MLKLLEYCRQLRAYGDSYGMAIFDSKGKTREEKDAFIKEMVEAERAWYEVKYAFDKETDSIEGDETTYEGELIVFKTHRVYLD